MRGQSMMKWRVRKDSNCSSIEHEDVRRSLDVLDSVLAEFDDCLESWDTHLNDKKTEFVDYNSNDVKPINIILNEDQLTLLKTTTDGSTSHISSNIVPEQPRVFSPPPIPKRSPATKLTGNVFTFPDTGSLDSFDLSAPDHKIREPPLSSAAEDKCTNCGKAVKEMEQQQQQQKANASSPFHQRKQMFEARIAEASISRSSSLKRSVGSSFKTKRCETSPNLLLSSDESGFENGSPLKNLSKVSSTELENGFVGHHAAKCTCRDRIRHLDIKFADIRQLIKLNKIRGLDSKPPEFDPPLPPVVSNGQSQVDKSTSSSPKSKNLSREYEPKTSFKDSLLGSLRSASSTNSLSTSLSDSRLTFSPLMCNRCISSMSVHLSETIEDLPKLLPTDALNRPHLGFSYSLEEDLPPGVKEIQQTSTPKSDISSPKLFRTKESNLSTFSHSASSLGYVSSQSDLDINDLSTIPDKVPLSSFKSRTLPNGLDRSPFYSAEDDSLDKSSYYSVVEINDLNDNKMSRHAAKLAVEMQDRSSIASLTPEPEKTKSKHFRVFSRKSKKDKKK